MKVLPTRVPHSRTAGCDNIRPGMRVILADAGWLAEAGKPPGYPVWPPRGIIGQSERVTQRESPPLLENLRGGGAK